MEITLPFEKHFENHLENHVESEPGSLPDSQRMLGSPSYEIAYCDRGFLESDSARGLRIQAEHEKPEWFLRRYGVRSTVIVFGSARVPSKEDAEAAMLQAGNALRAAPDSPEAIKTFEHAKRMLAMSPYYEQAREFARIVSFENLARNKNALENDTLENGRLDYVICTGGGPGIMEAANRGAFEAGAISIGLNIKLPFEQRPNPYITPELCFQFRYFAIRKLHFLLRAKALVVAPGGFGTFDELFEALTLRQTNRMQPIPIILFGESYWRKCVDFDYILETGVIDRDDLDLFTFTESPKEAWDIIKSFHAKVC
ncbi:MAG TPA: 3-isopropylmalate dehydrogenase [Planctomycetaceae bacterium]|nr:3-isopropylmalate dehydrogenase [Planctomycetaceae bacterium]